MDHFALDTDDMAITASDSVSATSLVNLSCVSHLLDERPVPAADETMRMFTLPYDVIVTLAPSSGASGTDCSNQQPGAMTFYIDDPVTGKSYTSVVSSDIRNRWLHTAVGDFDGDGFDDLFIGSDECSYIATANDMNQSRAA